MDTQKMRAAIIGIEAYIPPYILTNDELSNMVDTTDEWIMTRVGIHTRHILKEPNEGMSYMAERAVKGLLEKTNTDPSEIDAIICSTVTGDMIFPATASIIADKCGIVNAMTFDMNVGCAGFIHAFKTMSLYIESGFCKKAIVVSGEKMSDVSAEIMERNGLTPDDIAYLLPHQANMRIIDAVANRMGISKEDKVLVNIEHFGNTSSATIPILMWNKQELFKKGDNLILSSFGAGFAWGSLWIKWSL